MLLFKYFKKWISFERDLRRIILKASLYSLRNEVYLRLGIYKQIRHLHNLQGEKDQLDQIDETEAGSIKKVRRVINLLEKHSPWKPKCYNRALTAKQLLDKKDIKTNIHIGFRKTKNNFDGHAWVTYKGKIVTGYLEDLSSFNEMIPANSSLQLKN